MSTETFENMCGRKLVFINIPIALRDIPGGEFFALLFFSLLSMAALTSTLSLLEVAVSYFIDERGWPRLKAVLLVGGFIALFGIPSALSFEGDSFSRMLGESSWFDVVEHWSSNLLLPLCGLGIATFMSWRVDAGLRESDFACGSAWGKSKRLYLMWLQLLRYVCPLAILGVLLHGLGVF